MLRRLTVELDAVGRRFAGLHGLGRTDVRALVAIMDAARAGRPMTAGALGSAVELSSASVTALVDRLERVGHVERVRDEHDRRTVHVGLTPEGSAKLDQVFAAVMAADEEMLAPLTPRDRASLERILGRWLSEAGLDATIPG